MKELNEKEIIDKYLNSKLGIEALAGEYKVGKLKIKDILNRNGIPFKRKGGQNKFGDLIITETKIPKFEIETKENEYVVAVCKITGKEYKDYSNYSGALTKHYKENFPEVKIPIDNNSIKIYYLEHGKNWFENYFDFIIKNKRETKKCPYCEWETVDLDNKSGVFQQHLKEKHNIDSFEHLKKYPDDAKYFINILKKEDRTEKLKNKDTVICEICGEKVLFIAGHLAKHNISMKEYRDLYPNSRIMGNDTKELFTKNENINTIRKFSKNSKAELEIKDFVESLGLKTKMDRTIINGLEIDIMIPELNIGIEYNGLYYHSDKFKTPSYHLYKTKICNEKGIGLIHIFEDEWITNKDLVKNKLKYIFKKHDGEKIYARKLIIKELKGSEINSFLNENHIQGITKINKICIGGFYNGELVTLMTFGVDNMTSRVDDYWELSRFCTKKGKSVIGGASKLLKYFIKNYQPKKIISFADVRWTLKSNDNLYTKLGFEFMGSTKPNYYYYNPKIDRYKRFHKYKFSKNKLKKIYDKFDDNKSENDMLKEMGYVRIFNCGLFRYVLNLERGVL